MVKHTELITATNFRSLCDQLAKQETAFKNILTLHGYPPFWKREASFETLIHIILEQQVSLASALAALKKLKEKLSELTPHALLALTDEELKQCYFSRQKIIYARHLAACIQNGTIDIALLRHLSDEEVSKQLQQVKGIGHWTTDVFLMMSLQRADCFPTGDIALVNSMKRELALPLDTSKEHLLTIADNWRPFRTVAAFMLWHAYLSLRRK